MTASLPVLWDTISRRILRRGQARVLDPQTQAESARAWLAQSLNVGRDAIKIIGLEPAGDGHRVELETPARTFGVEVCRRPRCNTHAPSLTAAQALSSHGPPELQCSAG